MAVNWLLSVLSRLLSAKRSASHLLVYVHFCLRHRTSVCLGALCHHRHWTCWLPSSLLTAQFVYIGFGAIIRGGALSVTSISHRLIFFLDDIFCILIFTADVKKLTKIRRNLCRSACIYVCPTFFSTNCSSTWHQAWVGAVWAHEIVI